MIRSMNLARLILFTLISALAACGTRSSLTYFHDPNMDFGAVRSVAVLPSGEEFSLELAIDPEKRALGYMFREVVGPNEGMLFIFETVDRHGIWMKNCKVPLDLIWLDDRLRVLEVAPDQQPCSPDRR